MITNAAQFRNAQSHPYTRAEKVGYILRGARQRFFPAKNLIAGPFAGEFGYELMQWQGYVRSRRKCYEANGGQTHVISYPGRDYLYEGCTVSHHDILLQKAGYSYGLLSPADSIAMAEKQAAALGWKSYDIFMPAHVLTQYHKKLLWKQDFRLLEEPPPGGRVHDVAFHFRSVQKDGPDLAKNYPPDTADELARRCIDAGMSVICVGHPDYAYCAHGCEDMRRLDLRESVAAMHSARIVAGENSGAMHLANLCGKPTMLWANDQWRIDYSLRWNPFRVPIYIAANDTAKPAPDLVRDALSNALRDLSLKTDGFQKPCYTLPAQQIAYY